MNVLLYAGSTTPTSRLTHQLQESLRRVLSSAYDIKLVNPQILNHHPWQNHTSLVIFPNLDQGEHDALPGSTRQTLLQWVGRGGRFLGIGTGARFAGKDHLGLLDLDWTREQSPPLNASSGPQFYREITFLQPGSQNSTLSIDSQEPFFTTNLPSKDDVNQPILWASCRDNENQERIVGVGSSYQAGNVALVGFDLSFNLERLVEILKLVGLEGLNATSDFDLGERSTLYLLSCLSSSKICNIHQSILEHSLGEEKPREFKDAHNTFMISTDTESATQNLASADPCAPALILCYETSLHHSIALSFDMQRYFSLIDQSSAIGNTILCGEIVPSTQTLLEKNSKLAALLPSGTVSVANKQTKGRGRGTNSWISTTGSIQFSLLVKAENLGSSLVFVQYLFGLAVIEWIEKKFNGKLLVRLKWPNDIYGSTGGNAISDFKKMGGILINCSFGGLKGSENNLVIGLGLNHHLAPHSTATSLAELIHKTNEAIDRNHPHDLLEFPSVEETIAGILSCFGLMWNQFLFQGFKPFMSLYLSRWLHTDQIITYETTGERLKIIGLDPSFGLLRTKLIDDSYENLNNKDDKIIDLQPDSNSFDIFSGLIKTKA